MNIKGIVLNCTDNPISEAYDFVCKLAGAHDVFIGYGRTARTAMLDAMNNFIANDIPF